MNEEQSRIGDAEEKPRGDQDDRLVSWKRIGAYLNRDVRTLRRWEQNEGLPIHRLMHEKLPTVYAYKSELDAWWSRRETATTDQSGSEVSSQRNPTQRHPAFWVVVTGAVAAVCGVVFWLLRSEAPAATSASPSWVLIADFDNRSGDPALDGTVEYALALELNGSDLVNVVPRDRVDDALRLMRRPGGTRIDERVGREVVLRDGDIGNLISGRIDKFGGRYSLGINIVDPVTGMATTSLAAEAANQSEVLPAVSRLAREVRISLGEPARDADRDGARYAKVTTSSVEALKLYTVADTALKAGERQQALPLLEQAITKDPDFASAHHLLYFVLEERDETERAAQHLGKATQLSEGITDRERLFILGTYYHRYLKDERKALESYETLLRLYPDHYWAASNAARLHETLGQFPQALPHRLARADLRPNLDWAQLDALQANMIWGRPADRERLEARVRKLATTSPWLGGALQMLPIQELWLQERYTHARSALDELLRSAGEPALREDFYLHSFVRSMYLALGDMNRFATLAPQEEGLMGIDIRFALAERNPAALGTLAQRMDPSFVRSAVLARAGLLEQAAKDIDDPNSQRQLPRPADMNLWRDFAIGELAYARGNFAEAVRRLSNAADRAYSLNPAYYLIATNSLARAYAALGRQDAALATLRRAAEEKAWSVFEIGATHLWRVNQQDQAALLRQADRDQEAVRIEGELDAMFEYGSQARRS